MVYSIAQVPSTTLKALTVAELIDYYLEHHTGDTFTVFPGEHAGDELSHLSFLEFGRASHRFARAIYPDAPVNKKEAACVIINADSLMWITAIAGIIRAGCTVRSVYCFSRVYLCLAIHSRLSLSHPATLLPPYVI
jgi:ATP-dependent protease HslVU (ClpYQ) peptidase subunit